ncbi:MAG TPA: hypothetical protein PLG59_12270 [bacterium]|nr:hypothetical protein [bacterium]HQO35433.1 hypothetical protein [bacterium]
MKTFPLFVVLICFFGFGMNFVATCFNGLTPVVAFAQSVAESDMEIRIRLDHGKDLGQNFGSLFEARTKDGKYVLGAGFLGLYNTYYPNDRHTVHFFIRSVSETYEAVVTSLPRPGDLAGTYLFSEGHTLYAADPEVRRWNAEEGRWEIDHLKHRGRIRIGKDLLHFDGGEIALNGRSILDPPGEGTYSRFYYAHGHLFFYHTFWAGKEGYRPYVTDPEGYTKLYACPWHPDEGEQVDLSKAIVLTVPVVGENPFSYGQFGNEVLTCSNIGGLYAFNGKTWRTVLDGELKTSYQVYSMLNYYDRLLLGQYPTGEIFAYDGSTVTHLEGWPPRMEGVSSSAREAQTMTLYGGELFVGVWPWGELWCYHPDIQRWIFVRRMMTHPPVTDKTTHPYEQECIALGGVLNQWGQRVTSLVVLGPSLMISTSAKWPSEYDSKFAFLSDDRWKEYGAVTRLDIPGHLSAPLRWTDGPTELRFIIKDNRMRIVQDAQVLAEVGIPEQWDVVTDTAPFKSIMWEDGIYGPFGGATLLHDVIIGSIVPRR